MLELAWTETPAVTASVPGTIAVHRPATAELPFADGAAGAVLLLDPPREHAAALLQEACRIARGAVIALAPLKTFDGRTAGELSPPGWRGHEQAGPGDVPLRFATALDATDLEMTTLDDRERWLDMFAGAAFGSSERRLWVWQPLEPGPLPDKVLVDPTRVTLWRPVAAPPGRQLRSLRERVIDRLGQRTTHPRRGRADPRRPTALLVLLVFVGGQSLAERLDGLWLNGRGATEHADIRSVAWPQQHRDDRRADAPAFVAARSRPSISSSSAPAAGICSNSSLFASPGSPFDAPG